MILDLPPQQLILPEAPAIIRPGVDIARYFPVELDRAQRRAIVSELVKRGALEDRLEARKLVEAAIPFGMFGAKAQMTLSFVASSTSTSSICDIPASKQAGDFALLLNYSQNSSGTPASVASGTSGFTNDRDISISLRRCMIRHRVLTGSEASVQCMNGSTRDSALILLFRPSIPITSVTLVSGGEEGTLSNPAVQNILMSGQAAPALLAGHCGSSNPPSQSGTLVTNGVTGNGPSTDDGHVYAYEIQNTSPADRTYDSTDVGSNIMQSVGYAFT